MAHNEIESHKVEAEKVRTELDALKLEQTDLKEAYRLGFKDVVVLARKEFPIMPMQWLSIKLFGPSMSKKFVEALGDLFRVARMEQSLSHNVLPKCSSCGNEHGLSLR
ncbi:hypothetical protein ACH5RR_001332 [Cinchona calisaya]|uniref:Uncharacterized protein n=1 Tax=Cinchona calisaya TaxID=153742 RepID=A0ABD3B3Q2_9GENT